MKRKKLKEVIVSITDRCNLKCKMCDIPLKNQKDALSTKHISDLIHDLKQLDVQNLVFSGGEPLLRNDIYDLIRESHSSGFRTCLTTNGTLVTKDVAMVLKDSGIDIVNVSIEGPESIHDDLRGKGSYRKSIEALKYLQEVGVETTIATCVSRFNWRALSYIMELAYSLGVTTVLFQGFSNLFLKDPRNDFWLDETDLENVQVEIKQVLILSKRYRIGTNPEVYLKQLPVYLSGKKAKERKKGCLALWESCAIDSAGNVYPCWVMNTDVVGNITRESILRFWGNKQHNMIRNNILGNGCAGCFLSCYDDEYTTLTPKTILDKIVAKINKYTKHHQKISEITQAKDRLKRELNSVKS